MQPERYPAAALMQIPGVTFGRRLRSGRCAGLRRPRSAARGRGGPFQVKRPKGTTQRAVDRFQPDPARAVFHCKSQRKQQCRRQQQKQDRQQGQQHLQDHQDYRHRRSLPFQLLGLLFPISHGRFLHAPGRRILRNFVVQRRQVF